MELTQAVKSLAALAQESRLAIYKMLVQVGPSGMAAGKISEQLGVSASALSFHMKELLHAGLVTSRHEGRYVIYCAQITRMNELLAYLTENCCGGNPCSPLSPVVCKPDTESAPL
jgi:DNA-binding transcriptional ArsR family regulator